MKNQHVNHGGRNKPRAGPQKRSSYSVSIILTATYCCYPAQCNSSDYQRCDVRLVGLSRWVVCHHQLLLAFRLCLRRIGTAGIAVQVVGSNWPKPHYTLLITGLCRFRVSSLLKERPFVLAEVKHLVLLTEMHRVYPKKHLDPFIRTLPHCAPCSHKLLWVPF